MAILRDEVGNPIPQYQTATPNVFEAAKGSGGAIDVNVKTISAGTNVIGKVGVDQTTDGTTNRVVSKISQAAGENVVAVDGVDGTGIVQPTGGSGSKGWLSGIFNRLAGVMLAAGTAIIGKVGIDQTTDGTTNRVVSKISQAAGENVITVADGGITTIGLKADASITDSTQSGSMMSFIKGILSRLSGILSISLISGTAATATLQAAAGAVGNGTNMDVSGMGVAVLDVQGVFVGTVVFEFSTDDTVWYPINGTYLGTGTIANSTTGTGAFQLSVAGLKSIRARISAWTSGTITVKGRSTPLIASEKAISVTGSLANIITLQNVATATGVGSPYALQNEKTILIEIYGTATSSTVSFEGIGASGTNHQIMGVRLSDLATAVSTVGLGEYWQFDVTGLVSFQANITAIAGGNVTVKGKAVA